MLKRADGKISRTQLLNAVSGAIGAGLVALPTVQDSLPPEAYGWIFMGFAMLNGILRKLTTQPLK